jgi:hypothetical protein
MGEVDRETREGFAQLVAGCRDQCLWFLREDYCPADPEGMRRVLEYIRRHGDRESFRAASTLLQWLSPDSSERSAAL